MNKTLALALYSICILAVSTPAHGKKIRQSLKIVKEKSASGKVNSAEDDLNSGKIKISAEDADTIWLEKYPTRPFLASEIRFVGYDKSINATKESVHVVNGSGFRLKGLALRITYLDMQGRMLHTRALVQVCDIPDKETRKIDFPTWDKQKSFYYHLGPEPRKVASPYNVRIEAIDYYIDP